MAPSEPPDPAKHAVRVAAQVADFVQPAKSNAYDKLDDGERAAAIAASWLIAKRAARAPMAVR